MKFDVVIVGAGLAGLATAYHLSKNSQMKIAVLDREAAPACHASGRNAGILRQAVPFDDVIGLIQETLKNFMNPPEDFRRKIFFRTTGSLLLGGVAQIEKLAGMLRTAGGRAEIFPKGAHHPGISREIQDRLASADYEVALWTPEDGVVDVAALSANFFDAAQARGVAWFPSCAVDAISCQADHWLTIADEKKFESRFVVNAAGAWAKELSPTPEKSDAMQSFRRHLMMAESASKPSFDSPVIWNVEHEFYFRPEAGGWLLSPGDEDLHPTGDRDPDPRALGWLEEKLTRHFPALSGLEISRSWACFRAKIPGLGGRIGWQQPGYLWVVGLGGHGVSCSWGAGLRAADEILRASS